MGKGGEGRRGGEEIQNKLNYQLVLGIIRSSSEHNYLLVFNKYLLVIKHQYTTFHFINS